MFYLLSLLTHYWYNHWYDTPSSHIILTMDPWIGFCYWSTLHLFSIRPMTNYVIYICIVSLSFESQGRVTKKNRFHKDDSYTLDMFIVTPPCAVNRTEIVYMYWMLLPLESNQGPLRHWEFWLWQVLPSQVYIYVNN